MISETGGKIIVKAAKNLRAALLAVFVLGIGVASAEGLSIDEFKKSSLVKAWPQKKTAESWALKNGGRSNNFTFDLGINKDSLVFVEAVSNDKNIIDQYSLMFHSDFMSNMGRFLRKFVTTIGMKDPKAFIDYVIVAASIVSAKRATLPERQFGPYVVVAENFRNMLTVSFKAATPMR